MAGKASSETQEAPARDRMGAPWLLALPLIGVLGIAFFLSLQQAAPQEMLIQTLSWIENLGPWSVIVFAALYLVFTPLCIPTMPLYLAGGFIFGFWSGLAWSFLGNMVGGVVAFRIARSSLRPKVRRVLRQGDLLSAVDRAIQEEGFRTACLIRMSPILPGPLINYGLGLTAISQRTYLLAAVGTLPTIAAYTFVGASLWRLSAVFDDPFGNAQWLSLALVIVGIAVTGAASWLVARQTRRLRPAS